MTSLPKRPVPTIRSKPHAYHGGDLRGIQNHLPYLKDLGVTALWLTPIVKNGAAQDYHGLWRVDLYAVDGASRRAEDYQDLVAAVHKQGMRLFFDAVPNHVGPKHPWAANPPLPDCSTERCSTISILFAAERQLLWQNWRSTYRKRSVRGASRSSRADAHETESYGRMVLRDFAGHEYREPIVEQYLLQTASGGAETSGLDGFRVDTFPYVGRKFWANWHADCAGSTPT